MQLDLKKYIDPRSIDYKEVIRLTKDPDGKPHPSLLIMRSLVLEGGFGLEFVYDEKGVEMARRAAETEDPIGLARYGVLAHYGYDTTDAVKLANSYIRRALRAGLENEAKQDNTYALTLLGLISYSGLGGYFKSEHKAFRLYLKAAELGDPFAQSLLGDKYEGGAGTEQDLQAALDWHTKAAVQGLATSQNILGDFYMRGLTARDGQVVLRQDKRTACEWWLKAAEQDYAWAQRTLGLWHATCARGRAVNDLSREENEALAFYWNRLAADHGHVRATIEVGKAHARGTGVEQNYAQAYYELANLLLRDNRTINGLRPNYDQWQEVLAELTSLTAKAEVIVDTDGKKCWDWGEDYKDMIVVPSFPPPPKKPPEKTKKQPRPILKIRR